MLWQEEGDDVILLADMNKEGTTPPLTKLCRACHLVEAISILHGQSPIPTHQWGQRAIDGIYILESLLHNAQGGFLSFGKVMSSDHCDGHLCRISQHGLS